MSIFRSFSSLLFNILRTELLSFFYKLFSLILNLILSLECLLLEFFSCLGLECFRNILFTFIIKFGTFFFCLLSYLNRSTFRILFWVLDKFFLSRIVSCISDILGLVYKGLNFFLNLANTRLSLFNIRCSLFFCHFICHSYCFFRLVKQIIASTGLLSKFFLGTFHHLDCRFCSTFS